MPSNEVITKNREVIADIRRKAVSQTTYIKLFTQTPAGEAYAILDANGVPGGICCALSMHWLQARAAGKDYMDSILGPGGTVNKKAIQPAIDLQKEISDPNTQLQKAKAWLEKRGFSGTQKPTTQVSDASNGVGTWFSQPYSKAAPFRLLGTRGYNHATALDLSKPNDLAFFDPNLGGFHFNSMARLKKFLDEVIYPSSKDKWGGTDCHYLGKEKLRITLLEMGSFNH